MSAPIPGRGGGTSSGDSGAARSLTALLGLPEKLTLTEADQIAEGLDDYRADLYYLCLGSRQTL